MERGYVKAADKANQRLGRLRERYPGFGMRFAASIEVTEDGTKATKVCWERLADSTDKNKTKTDPLHGCYVIETPHIEESGPDIWKLYMTLTRVEDAFRSLKTDLGTRPIHHQLGHRTAAHLFISVLAYHLLISIEYQLHNQGSQRQLYFPPNDNYISLFLMVNYCHGKGSFLLPSGHRVWVVARMRLHSF